MKKAIILFAIVVPFVMAANAQKIRSEDVPAPARESFAKAHPGLTGKWEKEKGHFEVNFTEMGKTMSCVIDKKGTILETEKDIKVSELPPSVRDYVKMHYKGNGIKEAARIVKKDGTVNYEAEVNGKDVMFDSNGKYIKEDKE